MSTASSLDALTGFAVDLGGTKLAAARFERGKAVGRERCVTDGAASLEVQVDAMAQLLRRLGHRHGAPLGVAVTGRLDRDGRWGAVNVGTLSSISDVPLVDALMARFGAACALNDAAAAAWAESRFGAGIGAENFLYLTVSTGVGGGVVLGDRLVSSPNGLAGHVGFVSTPEGGDLCGSGRTGTVESVAGGRALAAAAAEAGYPELDARGVFAASAQGESWAEVLVARSARTTARLVADITAVLGLERVALGGSIGLAPCYLDRMEASLAKEPVLFRPELCRALLGQDSALVGALAQAIEKQETQA
ncbi:ROK family protein [Sulfitobacter sp. 915]|uniref:ROK family protein n=1 Tax=Sulfitobacter sp. 915 TaxID=3368558 RepID=UPI00374513C0